MSNYITIPSRGGQAGMPHGQASCSSSSSSSSFPTSSSSADSPRHIHMNASSPSTSSSSPSSTASHHERRPSLLGSALSKQEHTVINVGRPDGPARLISCVKASQGFDWNQDIFLPSYGDHDGSELERKQDPVHDIILTDAEIEALFPQ